MAEPSDIEVTRTVEYRLGVDFQLNEQPGKLKPLVGSTGSYSDKMAQIEDRFDDLEVHEITERNGDTKNTDVSAERRWILKPRRQNVAPLIDRDDSMSTKIDLKSPISVQTAKAIRRAQDDRWLEGFYGTAYVGEGEDALSAVPFKSANIMAADEGESSDSGITLNKLIAMQELFRTRLVDTEAELPVAIITAKQITDLLKINQLQSRDYNPMLQQALQSGKPGDFMGFRFVMAEIGNSKAYAKGATLSVDSSSNRRVPFFVPSGMHFGIWEEFYGRITERDDKNFSMQVYAETCGAATRLNEDKCFQMLCKES